MLSQSYQEEKGKLQRTEKVPQELVKPLLWMSRRFSSKEGIMKYRIQ
jgi:hypothetical protein